MAIDESAEFTLYGNVRSGNSYKAALMLALTETPYRFRSVDLMGGENLRPAFLRINPLGKVPVLKHKELVIRQSYDALRYLADVTGKFGPHGWQEEARVGEWVGFSVDFLTFGVSRLRFINLFTKGMPEVFAYFKPTAERGLGIIETHLKDHEWLAAGRPTALGAAGRLGVAAPLCWIAAILVLYGDGVSPVAVALLSLVFLSGRIPLRIGRASARLTRAGEPVRAALLAAIPAALAVGVALLQAGPAGYP